MRRELMLASALAFTAAACGAETVGQGTYSQDCIDQTTTLTLNEGDEFALGIQDMSFSSGNGTRRDIVEVKRSGSNLIFDGIDFEHTTIDVDGVSSDVSEPFTLVLSNETRTGTLEEEGEQVIFSANIDEQDMAVVALSWSCQSKDR